MKNIMYVHHGDIKGGAPMSLRFLLDKIDIKKYKPMVVCRVSLTDSHFFDGAGIEVIVEPRIKPFHGSTVSGINFKQICYNFFYAIPTYRAMKHLVKKNHPDVVHLNSTCLFMCAKASKSVNKNIKVICHVREPLLPNIWGDILKKMCNRYCDQFIAIDEYDRKSVDPCNKKSKVIYNFVDFNKFNYLIRSDDLRKRLNLCCSSVIFLVLARISPENGILELIEKWRKYIKNDMSHLVVVGEIEGREKEYTDVCHQISDAVSNIHILPFQTDTVSLIASSDVMICPFIRPHFARLVIEGAAMKKTTFSNFVDGPKELIIDRITGMFYNTDRQFCDGIDYLTNNKETRLQLGENAYNRAKQLFNANLNAVETFSLYD